MNQNCYFVFLHKLRWKHVTFFSLAFSNHGNEIDGGFLGEYMTLRYFCFIHLLFLLLFTYFKSRCINEIKKIIYHAFLY